jgi:tetratricopeptide (TPR) repeat protein
VQAKRANVRRVIVAGLVTVGAFLPATATGQLARTRSNERLLILAPLPGPSIDTAFAITTGEALRDRMASRYRMRMGIIPTTTICEALEASGFNCKVPLPPENAPPLTRFLQATAYMVGWLDRSGDSLRLRLRLVDAAGSGLGGWETIRAPATTTAEDLGKSAADDLDNQLRAAEHARDCTERRQRGDAKGAVDRANRAFALYPNHPGAAMCLAYAYEVQQLPVDSIVVVLRKAVAGDSLNGNAWEELGRRLRDKGDEQGALDAFYNQLRSEPTNQRLRIGVAAGLAAQGDYARAVEVIDAGLVLSPGDHQLLQLKERACLDASMWVCGLAALEAQYDLDTALGSDTIFFQKTFGAAQSIPDTAAMLRWSRKGVDQFPDWVASWRARAATLKLVDERAAAIAAYQRIVTLDSTQVGSALAAAQLLLDSTLVIDTAVPLDTARLRQAEELLVLAGHQLHGDTATSMAIATMFYNPASKIAQLRMAPHLATASRFLEHALEYDLRKQLQGPANFFLGLSLFFQITELDTKVRESKDCAMVDVEIEMTRRARAALEAGRQISPQTVNQLLGYVGQIEGALPTYKPVFGCPGA